MRYILTAVLIQFCLTAFGQLDIKEVEKTVVKINDSLYASKFEVSNSQYISFINALKKANQKEKLEIAQIDTSLWNMKPYAKYYHTHPAYKDYPVVNISYDGAIMFCDYLTNEYNSSPARKYKKVKFRLPTEQEWILAAKGGGNSAIYPWQGSDLKDKKGRQMCNFVRPINDSMTIAGTLTDDPDITAPVKSYSPNKFGLYNMSGNVAEMIAEKSSVKGGSWFDKSEFMTIISKQEYDGNAKITVGFRYFLDIIEK
jgi:sulfatase modifying factor 1